MSTDVRGRSRLAMLLDLTRVRVTVAVTLTTATGYFLGAGRFDHGIWLPVFGVFLLASGATALNQCQEHRLDARMARTRRRPIPAGEISLAGAFFVAGLLILLGFVLLTSIAGDTTLLMALGALSLLWYNGVYTYLKRITAFAVVPGALIGAIPPVIGFVAAGQGLDSPLILLVAAFFFIWQIPHFWLLLLMCGGQYAEAGLPTLTQVFSPPQLARVTFMWLLAAAAAGLAFPTLAPGELAMPCSLAIVLASFWLALKALSILQGSAEVADSRPFHRAFVRINAYALVVMACLSLSALLPAANV